MAIKDVFGAGERSRASSIEALPDGSPASEIGRAERTRVMR